MYIKDVTFRVEFSVYSEKHFCKEFLKKYKAKKWIETRKTIIATLKRAHAFQQTNLIDVINFSQEQGIGIFKLDFAVAGTNTSPKASGNRTIFSLSNKTGEIKILLAYGKNHCPKKQSETQWIAKQVKKNFPEYRGLI